MKAAQPFTIEHLPTGQPALYCKRGLVAIFEAGYQQTREQDAAEVVRILNAHGELVEALQKTCSIVDSFLNGPGEDVDFMDEVLIKARAALARAKGDA